LERDIIKAGNLFKPVSQFVNDSCVARSLPFWNKWM
jgi:hypothetical protein